MPVPGVGSPEPLLGPPARGARAWRRRLGGPQTNCHHFPFCSGRQVRGQSAFAAFSLCESCL